MPDLVADKDYWSDADGKLVDEAAAAFLVARKGTAVSAETAERYGIKAKPVEAYDAVAEHESLHGGETEPEAKARRTAMFDKARKSPPADK